jgi:hypothetical protein
MFGGPIAGAWGPDTPAASRSSDNGCAEYFDEVSACGNIDGEPEPWAGDVGCALPHDFVGGQTVLAGGVNGQLPDS